MNFHATGLEGAFLVEIEKISDERGFFARAWCHREAREHGIQVDWVQCNISHNLRRGTLRGMHWQEPDSEAKLVRATRGAIFDVIVDMRTKSATRGSWYAAELTAQNRQAIFIPRGFAHGFVSLEDDSEIFYQMSEYYSKGQDRGFRYDDATVGIEWPLGKKILSDRDLALPGFPA
jgi:dTDP-4-dehydrorhamnose 3,5-epimerase